MHLHHDVEEMHCYSVFSMYHPGLSFNRSIITLASITASYAEEVNETSWSLLVVDFLDDRITPALHFL